MRFQPGSDLTNWLTVDGTLRLLELHCLHLQNELACLLNLGSLRAGLWLIAGVQLICWLIDFKINSIKKMLYCCCCSVTNSCPTLCNPVDCSTPGFPVLLCLPEFAQTHVHWVNDAIQPSHPLSPPSPPALNLSQHQGLFQWVGSSHKVVKEATHWNFVVQHHKYVKLINAKWDTYKKPK